LVVALTGNDTTGMPDLSQDKLVRPVFICGAQSISAGIGSMNSYMHHWHIAAFVTARRLYVKAKAIFYSVFILDLDGNNIEQRYSTNDTIYAFALD
jgi:hypothetical protein